MSIEDLTNNLFGDEKGEGEEKEGCEETSSPCAQQETLFGEETKNNKKDSKGATKGGSQELKFDDTWVICYASHQVAVADLGVENYTEDGLKKALAKSFPEFGVAKAGFKSDNKKKAIAAFITGDKKGLV